MPSDSATVEKTKNVQVTGRLHPDNHPDIFSHGQDKINIENPDRTTPTPPPIEIGLEQTIDVGSRVRDLVCAEFNQGRTLHSRILDAARVYMTREFIILHTRRSIEAPRRTMCPKEACISW